MSMRALRIDNGTIEADQMAIDAGLALYELIARSNEIGISPETYRIYEQIILPLTRRYDGIPGTEIVKSFLQTYGRPLAWDRLTKHILPALESVGLIRQEKNPDDKREILVYCTAASGISDADQDQQHTGDLGAAL